MGPRAVGLHRHTRVFLKDHFKWVMCQWPWPIFQSHGHLELSLSNDNHSIVHDISWSIDAPQNLGRWGEGGSFIGDHNLFLKVTSRKPGFLDDNSSIMKYISSNIYTCLTILRWSWPSGQGGMWHSRMGAHFYEYQSQTLPVVHILCIVTYIGGTPSISRKALIITTLKLY